MKLLRFIITILLSFLLSQCSHSKNFEDAEIIQNNDSIFIKLKGKRKYMNHDLSSVNRTYIDSVLIQIPYLKNGVIKGEVLPVRKGNYNFKGQIVFENKKLRVELVVIDTDDKKDRPYSWNGEYKLLK